MAERSLGHQSTIVFGGLATSIALGVVVQSYLAGRLGTSALADAFYLGTAIPTLIATATLGSSSNALIRYATETPEVLDPRIARSAGQFLVLLSLALSALMAVAGVLLVGGVAAIGDAEATRRLGTFLLIVAVVPGLIAWTAIGTVLALADHDFVRAAWGGAANGLGLLVATIVASSGGLTASKLALAVDFGYVAQLAFVLPAFRRLGLRHGPGRPIDRSTAWAATIGVLVLIGASIVYKSQPLVERAVGASVGTGVPAALGYTDKITMALSQLAAFGFAMASLPSLSRDLAASDHASATGRLRVTLVGTLVSTAVVLAFALSSSTDIVRVLYERGNFSGASADLTHSLMLFALPSVAFGAVAGPLVSLAYANKRVRQVALVGLAGFVVGTTLTIVLAATIGPRGIVLGTAAGFATTLGLFMRSVGGSLPEWSWTTMSRLHGGEVLAAAGATAVVGVVGSLVPVPGSTLLAVVVLGVRLGLLALTGFGTLLVVRRLRQRVAAAPAGAPAGEAEREPVS